MNKKTQRRNPGGEDWQAKYEAEAAAHQAALKQFKSAKKAQAIDNLVADQLRKAGLNAAVIPKAIKLYDRAIVQTEGGQIANLGEVLSYFKAEWGDFYARHSLSGTQPPTPPAAQAPFCAGSVASLMQAANAFPERLEEILAQIHNLPKEV
jgi:hypothetical protein